MDEARRDGFTSLWSRYFGDTELPIAVFYSDADADGAAKTTGSGPCIVNKLPLVRKGQTVSFSAESRICGGARTYFGFTARTDMRNFEYFLSYGIPGKLEGERYKKSPELVRESMRLSPSFKAPKKYIVFKRWDRLLESDEPEIVFFLAGLDVIAGLFTLANFDEAEPNAVICPFGSGCSSIVYHPYQESQSGRPRCVLGMFDISARPYVGENTLSFAIPMSKFQRMVDNMNESFLTTDSWKGLRKRRGPSI